MLLLSLGVRLLPLRFVEPVKTSSPNTESLPLLANLGIWVFLGDDPVDPVGGLRLEMSRSSSGGGGDGAGDACLEPAGLKPRPRNGLTLPDGDGLLEPGLLVGSAIIANDWFLCLLDVGVSLKTKISGIVQYLLY